MTIVVTGGNGTIGRALRTFLPDAVYLSRQDCDVTDDRAVNRMFEYAQPEVVIHAAAITDHQHPNAAEVIETNIVGTEYVARHARAYGAKLVYLSTHYVYPGEIGNYKEHERTRPIGAYAWSKLAGEGWARLPNHNWLIIRGSWYTWDTRVKHWMASAVDDAYTSREPAIVAARKIANLVTLDATGVFNIGGPRRTFYEIALYEAECQRPTPCSRKDLVDLPYAFPKDSSVNTDKYRAFVGE